MVLLERTKNSMPNIDISIVIVNYNVKDFLHQCLESIRLSSKDLLIETIVVDNNSSDNSVNYLQPLFPDVSFIALDENIGFGKANNVGFEKASGKYVLILNPDTILSEDTLTSMMNYMEDNPNTGMAGCKVLNPDGTFQLACRRGFPTPWAAFTKLFGLQKLFPRSKIFAQYNLTYLDENDTYPIDALIGAFMFCRKDALDDSGGFDPDYFMYGEDIDLCYKFKEMGWRVDYAPVTSIVHFKGESTKRSSINEVHHFYDAMQIFVKKHYGSSNFFLKFLKFGIFLRTILAYLSKHKRSLLLLFADLLIINSVLIFSSNVRFGNFFPFPDYAYPIVFIVISITLFTSMIFTGEYFEDRTSIRKAFTSYLITFFFLSSLTYFFKEYAFSRGILLLTIGLSIIFSTLFRGIIALFDNAKGKKSDKRAVIVGTSNNINSLINAIRKPENIRLDILGLITTTSDYIKNKNDNNHLKLPILGNFEYLSKVVEENDITEIIICDNSIKKKEIFDQISKLSTKKVRLHIVDEYEDFIASSIINDIAGIDIIYNSFNISKFRYKLVKRITDLFLSLFFLTIGLPLLYLLFPKEVGIIKNVISILKGKLSFVGYYPLKKGKEFTGKPGLIGLAHLSRPDQLSETAIENLNNYYIQNYTISMDIDIFLKFIFRKKNGSKTYT